MSIYEQVPFPEQIKKPSALALKLQEKIQYMFGIIVEPVIIRHAGSYYKTIELRYRWSMTTPNGRYIISCYEPAAGMANKKAWHVLDQLHFLKYQDAGLRIGKVIY